LDGASAAALVLTQTADDELDLVTVCSIDACVQRWELLSQAFLKPRISPPAGPDRINVNWSADSLPDSREMQPVREALETDWKSDSMPVDDSKLLTPSPCDQFAAAFIFSIPTPPISIGAFIGCCWDHEKAYPKTDKTLLF